MVIEQDVPGSKCQANNLKSIAPDARRALFVLIGKELSMRCTYSQIVAMLVSIPTNVRYNRERQAYPQTAQ